jgi:DNA polymerase II small subunit
MNEILKLCASKGFLLDREMLDLFSGMEFENTKKIIEILAGDIKERVVTKVVFDSHVDKFRDLLVVEGGDEVAEGEGVNILSSPSFRFKKIEVGDFVRHFRARFEAIKSMLEKRDLDNLSSIRRLGTNDGVYSIIAMVGSKRITKNKNLLVEVEDLTGKALVLINRDNKELFSRANDLLLDDIVVFRASGSSDMLFVNDIIYPDASLKEERYSEFDEYVAFGGDFHVGSKMFLEKNLLKFVDWLNGDVGDARQKAIARKVKYLFLTGDNIDGVSHYPGQEKFLNIKTCRGQYQKVEEILKKIRKDIQIVICPGQHDAVWVGEPQPVISEKWAPGLHRMENVHLIPNPALVEIHGGFKVLTYHGASINHFINELPEIRVKVGHGNPTRVVKEMLKRRHLAPIHGLMDYIPCEGNDPMVVDIVPDIIATADQHRAEVDSYNNILLVASSCWQSITPFEEKVGNIPDPCKVPLFNLKTREIKIMDFSEDKIKWEEGDDLVCKLEVKDV